MNIRACQEQDLEQLRQIYLKSRRESFTWLDTCAYQLSDFDRDTAAEMILVAASDSGVHGFSSSWVPDRFIHHLYVDPSCIGAGVGTLLLAATIAALGLPARLKCLRLNQRALRFYRSRGWEVVGNGSGADGDFYEMERRDQKR